MHQCIGVHHLAVNTPGSSRQLQPAPAIVLAAKPFDTTYLQGMKTTAGGAAEDRQLDVLEHLFSRQFIRQAAQTTDARGRTFLFYMAACGHAARPYVFDCLLETASELGLDINHQVRGATTATGHQAHNQMNTQQKGAHISRAGPRYNVSACLLTVVEILLCPAWLQDKDGGTVLHAAMPAVARQPNDDSGEFVQRWMQAGARPRQAATLLLTVLGGAACVISSPGHLRRPCILCCSIQDNSGLRPFDVLQNERARLKCSWSLRALHKAGMAEASGPKESRGQRYLRRSAGEPGSAATAWSGADSAELARVDLCDALWQCNSRRCISSSSSRRKAPWPGT